MIIIKLIGGLGNQMFQYALGRKLSLVNKYPFKMDISWYVNEEFGRDIKREYSLKHFNVVEDFAMEDELKKFAYKKKFLYKLIQKFKKEVLGISNISFVSKILKTRDNSYLDGFWQSEKYFADIKDVLLKDFSLKDGLSDMAEEIEKQEAGSNSVSLHVRRGDYVSDKKVSDSIGICSPDHYREAIKIIKGKVPSPTFFIYSDDIGWVKDNLKIDAPTVYVSRPELKDYEELVLMSKCKHNIIANSSFSWWGAWLNQNPEKVVIAPKQWFKNPNINTKDVIPDSWMKI